MAAKSIFRDSAYQLWLCIALLCVMVAPTVWFIAAHHQARIDRLRSDGLVTMATVTGVREVEEAYTDRKGRHKTRSVDYIDLRYNMVPSTPYADFIASGTIAPHKGTVLMIGYSRHSSNAEVAAIRVGDDVPVVVDPEDNQRAELASFVRDFTSTTSHIIVAVSLLLAILSGWLAWRRRRVLLGGVPPDTTTASDHG